MSRRRKRSHNFVAEIPENLLCTHCHGVLKNAVRLKDCEHALCLGCLQKRRKNNLEHCPCSILLTEAPPDQSNELRKQVNELLVYCSKNCGKKIKLKELNPHLEFECSMQLVHCASSGCQIKIKRKDSERHTEVCDFRIVFCSGCDKKLKYADLRNHHISQGCMDRQLKQALVKQLREGNREVKRHSMQLKQDTFKTMRDERYMQKEYMWKRIERNPRSFSPSLVRRSHFERESISEKDSLEKSIAVAPTDSPHRCPSSRERQTGSAKNIICGRCGKLYQSSTNHNQSCIWHAGVCISN